MSVSRVGSRTAVTSKMERFVIIVNGFQPLTIITKRSILDVAAVLDPPLVSICSYYVKTKRKKAKRKKKNRQNKKKHWTPTKKF